MESELSLEGLWWHPDSPDKRVYGVLTFVPGQAIELNLKGDSTHFWSPFDRLFAHEGDGVALIHGIVDKGQSVSVIDCWKTSGTSSTSGYRSASFRASCLMRGTLIEDPDEIAFDAWTAGFSRLNEWFGTIAIESQRDFDENHRLRQMSANYRYPEDLSWQIADPPFKLSTDY
ncbi:MAG: hypothetical protein ACNA8W_21765, partial [Bradymonadaceae bacterium]